MSPDETTPQDPLEEYFEKKRTEIDAALNSWLPPMGGETGKLHEAMRYSVLAKGKRIRPVLCLTVAEGLGTPTSLVMKAACALEILHTYSLIHDDLPSMDNDDLRRGRPTSHKVFGEAIAILAGDALLTLSFEWFLDLAHSGIESAAILEAQKVFAQAIGYAGMVGGQVLDMESEGTNAGFERLKRIHELKTGALLSAAVEIGAILGNANRDQRKNLKDFGKKLGLLFQIVDDILDEEGDSVSLGKNPGSDRKKGKTTYPSVLGMEKAKEYARKVRDESIDCLSRLRPSIALLRDITEFVYRRSV